MSEPYVSEDFTMDDIRRIRDYNSERHIKMTRKEILEDIRNDADKMLQLIAKRKEASATITV